jgi:hypothetical protein
MTRWMGSAGAAVSRCSSTAVWKLAAPGETRSAAGLIFSSRVIPSAVTSRNVSSCSAGSRSATALTP